MTGYRYTLTRTIPGGTGRLCWVMLNPSTADETVDDPTIRRVIRFTKDAGYGEALVVNLFAARSTRPVHLLDPDLDPVGPHNRRIVYESIESSDATVCAWGAWYSANAHRVSSPPDVRLIHHHLGRRQPLCLGVTKHGDPRHPLYVPAAQPLVGFP